MESIILYHVVLIFAYLAYSLSKHIEINDAFLKKVIYVFSLLTIILFNGIRYNVGTDYLNYKDIFDGYTIISIEPIFRILIDFFVCFDNGFYLLIFLITCITYYLFFQSFKVENLSAFALFVFLSLNMCFFNNIIRQALAISIFYYSIKYLRNNQPFRYIISIIVATGIHYSAILLILVVFIRNIRLKFKVMLYALGALLFLSFFPDLFQKIFVNPILSIPFYGDYFVSENGEANLNSGYGVIAKLVLGILVLFLSKKYLDYRYSIFEILLFLGLIFTILGSQVIIFSRLTNYFYVSIVFLISPIFKKNIKNKYIYIYAILLISVLFFEVELFLNGNKAVPYHTIFNN